MFLSAVQLFCTLNKLICFYIPQNLGYNSIYIILLMNKENKRPATSRPLRNSQSALNLTKNQQTGVGERMQCHQQYLRMIIATNADYFQSKLGNKTCRSKDLKLKLPSRTGVTTYRKDYPHKNQLHSREIQNRQTRTEEFQNSREKMNLTISLTTNYQKQFKKHPIARTQSCRKSMKADIRDSEEVPRFLQTHNKMEFLNWAGKNCVASMKPMERSAVTNLPFEATSVYRLEFEGKAVPPTPTFVRQSSFPRFGIVPTIMRSNYSTEFCSKKAAVETCYRPFPSDGTFSKKFKGSTQYKRQFGCKQLNDLSLREDHCQPKTIDQLQMLIIDL